MFQWIFKFFRKREVLESQLIYTKMKDGRVVPVVHSDKLELIKNEDGSAEIRVKE